MAGGNFPKRKRTALRRGGRDNAGRGAARKAGMLALSPGRPIPRPQAANGAGAWEASEHGGLVRA